MDPIFDMPFNPLLGNFDFSSRLLDILSGSTEQFNLVFIHLSIKYDAEYR